MVGYYFGCNRRSADNKYRLGNGIATAQLLYGKPNLLH